MGAKSVKQLYTSKSFILNGPLWFGKTLQYGVHDCSRYKVPLGGDFIPFGMQ